MSYILDALKKSEKERQKKNLPDILTVQEPILNEKKRRSVWPYAIAVILLVNMGVFGYFLMSRESEMTKGSDLTGKQQSEGKHSELQKPQMTKNEIPAGTPDLREILNKKAAEEKQTEVAAHEIQPNKMLQSKTEQKSSIAVKSPIQPAAPVMKEPRPEAQSGQTQPALAKAGNSGNAEHLPAGAEQKSSRSEISPVPDKIYHTGELPQSIQQSLPDVSVSIFMYSDDPASRMVRINGQTYREGQKIAEDLKLEKITPNGIILNYRNYRFQVGQQHSTLTPLHQ